MKPKIVKMSFEVEHTVNNNVCFEVVRVVGQNGESLQVTVKNG